MLFQLPSFLIFLALFAGGLAICPRPMVPGYVFLASLIFYGWWYPPYTVVILAFVIATWVAGLLVRRRPGLLPLLVPLALLPLALFKYADFMLTSLEAVLNQPLPRLHWTLPLGVSFVTFTIISLLVDTARRPGQRAPNFMETAVYITFFPHLIAGPILRIGQILPQLNRIRLDRAGFTANLGLFAVGMLKKVLIADPIGAWVDASYAGMTDGAGMGTIQAWLTMTGFAIQIYCDFSAYSDMAIALAGMFGVRFPENFHKPYMATSMSELWRRWHMTLSFWLRDYVFKPLHKRFYRHARHAAIVTTMVISGLWHGADWTFVLWGLIQGVIMAAEGASGYAQWAGRQRGLSRALCIMLLFVVWLLAATFFRAPSIDAALVVLSSAFGGHGPGMIPAQAPLIAGLIAITLLLHPLDTVDRVRAAVAHVPAALALPVLLVVIIGCSMIAAGRPQTFYYFDF